MTKIITAAAILALAAACGGVDDVSEGVADVSLDEIEDLDDGSRVRITGALFVTNDTRLCGSVAESYPPQCGEPSVELIDLGVDSVIGLSSPTDPTFAAVTWTDYPLTVIGIVDSGSVKVTEIDQLTFASETPSPFAVRLGVNAPDRVAAGHQVWWSLDITPTADVVLTFTSGQDADVVLRDADGNEVYRWSDAMMFTQGLRSLDLAGGATYSTVLNGELVVEAGSYDIAGFFVAPEAADAIANGTIDVAG